MTKVVLASASPRRHELLSQIGVRFEVRVPDIDESPVEGEDPVAYVRRLAIGKAAAISTAPDELVIAADTTVDLDSVILGKPNDDHDARSMLRRLSGQTHRVHTGVAVRLGARELADVCTTLVRFVSLDEATIDWYLATGEPLGKAGSYALQGAGAALVSGVDGSVSNVIGLPLHLVVDLAGRLHVTLLTETNG
ncbi:MAG TPA: Maf family protein [Ilumatobacteraceae bacterium]|nr:Maf family protein [Ilumatobacteraceae bacterium]